MTGKKANARAARETALLDMIPRGPVVDAQADFADRMDRAVTVVLVVAMKATAGVVRVADPALVVEVVQAEEAVQVAEATIAVRQAAAASVGLVMVEIGRAHV